MYSPEKDESHMTLPSVAIIIPTKNRPEPLKCCLRQILPYVRQHHECMIVVTDDGDASETRGELDDEFSEVQVIEGPHRGPAANRNWGVANSCGHLLIFLDDDCTPEPNLIAEYQSAANESPECGVFEGRITAVGNVRGFADVAPLNETGGHLWSCNFAIRRELFVDSGGFDARFPFPAMEDIDLAFRLRDKSVIRFIPKARVFHAFERRAGWRILKHAALSLIFYLHLHGLKETKQGPAYFAEVLARLSISGSLRCLRRNAARDPQHLILSIALYIELFFVTCFWKLHPYLARKLFPPCCSGCELLHANMARH